MPSSASSDVLKVPGSEEKTSAQMRAEISLSPVVGNAVTARTFTKGTFGAIDLTDSVEMIAEAVTKVQSGDLSAVEATLTAQAAALNAIFSELARRAALNMGKYLPATETYLRLALKAQSQCRATLQTLAEIKFPRPLAFVRQANIAHGPQQVNNGGGTASDPTRAGISTTQSNELLESGNAPGQSENIILSPVNNG